MQADNSISPAQWTWRQLKGFAYIAGRTWCLNCYSEVLLFDTVRDNCPNDECYNFARGIDFWLTGEEWMLEPQQPIEMISRLDPQVARLLGQPNQYEPRNPQEPEGAGK